MNLYLRKVIHPQAHDNYRVILKLDGDEFEIEPIPEWRNGCYPLLRDHARSSARA